MRIKLDWKIWLILALTGVIILLILFQPSPQQPDTTAWKEAISRNKTKIEKLRVKHEKDSTASAHKLAQLRDSLKNERKHSVKLSINLARYKAKPEVIEIVMANPVIDTVFWHYDSLLQAKDQELAIQDNMIRSLEAENVRITDNFLERLQLSQDSFDAQKAISDSYKKENRKERRKVKLWKVGTVVGVVGGLLLGSSF